MSQFYAKSQTLPFSLLQSVKKPITNEPIRFTSLCVFSARFVKIPSHPEVGEDGWVSAFVMDPVTNEILCARKLHKKPIKEEVD